MTEPDDVATRLLGRPVRTVERLRGGEHAVTTVASDGTTEFVVRRFPAGDDAVRREVDVLPRLATLGDWVPHLIAHDLDAAAPVIVTTRVAGGPPATDLSLQAIARGMAAALARIHAVDGAGLPVHEIRTPTADTAIADAARDDHLADQPAELVVSHSDFWSGNAVWTGDQLTGVVDWSGARLAPRGFDVAWCRNDLILMGGTLADGIAAAELFTAEYERASGREVTDADAWDRDAAARADPIVQTWSGNYIAVGRTELTGPVLRRRLDAWTRELVIKRSRYQQMRADPVAEPRGRVETSGDTANGKAPS